MNPKKISLFAKSKHLEEPRGVVGGRHEGGEELGAAREAVPAGAVCQPPPDGPVGHGADQAVQHVLDQDVHGVLRPAFIIVKGGEF